MTNVSMDAIKELREKTGAGFGDCRKALIETQGNIEKAIDYLREKGITSAAKKSSRATKEGRIFSYIHTNGKIGSMVEINCETDFVARTDEFENLLKDIAMQVAAMAPLYVKREDIPEEVIKKEKEIYKTQLKDSGKPENVIEKIVEGKIEKFYKDVCLLEQTFIKDESKTIDTLVKEKIAKLGENIIIKRFVRFVVGE
ncbi:MAG: translation elongation factor Ts [Candidatus Goldbacteria bacterium]|nr:translation elongation factor Ts [Candidatus Goldiibacteriota bacterium]